MVDKKSSKVEVKEPIESNSHRFKRLAVSRTKSVLNAIRILGNCSNKTNYEYTKEQSDKILDTIQEAFNTMAEKFVDIKTEIQEFNL